MNTAPDTNYHPAYTDEITMNRRLVLAALAFVVSVLAACSGASSETSANIDEISPVEDNTATTAPIESTPPTVPGVIYMTSSTGDLVAFDPTTKATDIVWAYVPDELVAFDVAPAARSTELHVVLTDPGRSIATSLHTLKDGTVSAVENDFFTSLTLCMDQHAAADISLGHQLQLGDGADGSDFVPLAFDGGGKLDATTLTELTRVSVVCPRWTSDRSIVATAAPIAPADRSTVLTYVDTPDASYQIGVTGCSITPTSFSPDDSQLALDVTCYDAAWQASGLYLVDMASLRNGLSLDDMTKIGDGIYGRSTWHPSGEWIVVTVVDVVERHTLATDYSQEIFKFEVINVTTGTSETHELPGPASAGSFAWLDTALHSS